MHSETCNRGLLHIISLDGVISVPLLTEVTHISCVDVQWTDVLALMGDASDNVPGVKGIGPKGALSLIQRYGTIEGVIEHAAEVIPLHTCAL